jgi:hypothetical protein
MGSGYLMLPSSRKDAIRLNSIHYFTNKPCKNGHVAKRYAKCGLCEICLKKIHKPNKEYSEKYKLNNEEKLKNFHKEYRLKNKEKINKYIKQYKKENAAKMNALEIKRNCSKIKRTPKWLTKKDFVEIENIYKEAKEKTKLHKEQYHVDHIVPLNGRNVSGLHVPNNLQVIKATENLFKSNKYN